MTDKPEEKKETKLSKKVTDLVEEISKLSVIELSDLVSALQEKLGVSAMPMASAPTAPQAAATGSEAQTQGQGGGAATQSLTMTASGANKISVIKALREINQNWGLKEAKDMTENLPAEILKDVKTEEVKAAADKLKTAGATVDIK
jgi:large subunit ribosomal protein L7/L12